MGGQHQGTIKTWKDDKGFGFITPDDGGKEVFFHVSSLAQRQTRPAVNTAVHYTLTYDQHQRPQAIDIRFVHQPMVLAPTGQVVLPFSIVSIFFLVLVLATVRFHLSPIVLSLYVVFSMITIFVYQIDKSRALRGEWRIPEQFLHLLEFLGGWPGALIAQSYYRHKTIKSSYQLVYWLIIVLNLLVLVGYCVLVTPIFQR